MVGRYRSKTQFPDTVAGRLAFNLARLRERKGLSVRQAAALIGVPKSTWYAWENAQVGRLPMDLLDRALDALEASPGELFRRVPAKHREK